MDGSGSRKLRKGSQTRSRTSSTSECAIGLGRAGLIRALSSWDYRKRSICHEFSDLSRHRLLDLINEYKVYRVSDLLRSISTAITWCNYFYYQCTIAQPTIMHNKLILFNYSTTFHSLLLLIYSIFREQNYIIYLLIYLNLFKCY